MSMFLTGLVAASLLIPIAMSMDRASVSISFDELLTELNVRRCELLGNDAAINKIMHAAINKIMQLEDVSDSAL